MSKFLPKALIILLLFLCVMTFLILIRGECLKAQRAGEECEEGRVDGGFLVPVCVLVECLCMMLIVTEGQGGVSHCVGLRSDHILVTVLISVCQSVCN